MTKTKLISIDLTRFEFDTILFAMEYLRDRLGRELTYKDTTEDDRKDCEHILATLDNLKTKLLKEFHAIEN